MNLDYSMIVSVTSRIEDLTGRTYGSLSVVGLLWGSNRGNVARKARRSAWLCLCKCGKLTKVETTNLKSGHSTSCGCQGSRTTQGERATTHGKSQTTEWTCWSHIRDRCNNPANRAYPRYGGRGIRVCQRWEKSFENFYADMGPRPEGMTIERKNNDGDYEPGNCVWATAQQQARNRRTSRFITTSEGVSKVAAEWDSRLGRPVSCARIKRGWCPDCAVSIEPGRGTCQHKEKHNGTMVTS